MPKKRILVVDDEAQMVLLLRSALEGSGYEVETAFSAAEGLERLDANASFDLILLDFLMPGDLGQSLLRSIRQKEGLKDLPVIVVTAFSSRGVKSFLNEGATEVIFKPFSFEELLSRARFYLGQK